MRIRNKIIKKYFTIIEMLIVLAVIAILSSVLLVSVKGVREKARDIQRVQELGGLQKALEMYYSDAGSYPFWIGSSSDEGVCIEASSQLSDALVEYFAFLPRDPFYEPARCSTPFEQDCYCYVYKTAGAQQYKLFTKMEKSFNLAKEDRGIYDEYYELFAVSSVAASSLITFPQPAAPIVNQAQAVWQDTSLPPIDYGPVSAEVSIPLK